MNFLSFRFLFDLIHTLGKRWHFSTETENKPKQSETSLFATDQLTTPEDMEEFEFERLKEELLTQPMEKEGNQLFHRKLSRTSSWIREVSFCSFSKIHLVCSKISKFIITWIWRHKIFQIHRETASTFSPVSLTSLEGRFQQQRQPQNSLRRA